MGKIKRALTYARLLKKNGHQRAAYFKKNDYFNVQGDDCFFQPINFGTEPKLISFGSNVYIAAKVTFINHDVIHMMLNTAEKTDKFSEYVGPINFGNNIFIGSNSTILYGVSIGSNCIVAAGSLVNKSIPPGSIVAGVPARVIGSYDDFLNDREKYSQSVLWNSTMPKEQRLDLQVAHYCKK
ncbi:acyltransferase [Erysipelothrix anatis]|uniref:acyltransferase n=1 Tax=Erysipelothrix anatis TaxID=2683713 RepID=UPI00140D7D89|nr:acyltransferase [Erysipelothrix anatis]